ncbi:MAG: cytochrome b/b6 domain-containing protein [Deltaproteobacteria bacterium]|nr:cytochrome b/b6 domain-containing protein [Deltaproteobacteria bacterium]
MRIKRFTPPQRLFHFLLLLFFLIQGATGLSRMYIETGWGQFLAACFGGYEKALTIHIWIGIFLLLLFLGHLIYLSFAIDWKNLHKLLDSPDSLLPRWADLSQFFQHIGWFLGLSRAPEFDRWGYWEKFDYWAVFWGMVILGGSGLLMAYPLAASRLLPGWTLNVLFWIHRIEAILAMGHVFIIHFFIGHLRRHNFPMDRTIFEGSADLTAARHEKPAWISRLESKGVLQTLTVSEAVPARQIVFYLIGFAAMAVGLFLLFGGLINSPYITW